MKENLIRTQGIKLAKKFAEDVLSKERWFSDLERGRLYDLLLLTGSVVQGGKDKISDLDLFLLMPLKVQKGYKLRPIYEYDYNGVKVEVSNVTSEKLISDQFTKNHVYWWKDSVIIRGNKSKYQDILKKAGSYNKLEKKEKLWTLMALFEMNIIDLERIVEREDIISFELNFWDCIKSFCEFMLLLNDIQKRFKWYGKILQDLYPKVYEDVKMSLYEKDLKKKLDKLKRLNKYFQGGLIKNGFSKKEVEYWHNHNLDLLLFQRF